MVIRVKYQMALELIGRDERNEKIKNKNVSNQIAFYFNISYVDGYMSDINSL